PATSGNFFSALTPYNATPGEVQETLERISGAGQVEVSAGPGGEGGAERSYLITYIGGAADQFGASPRVSRTPAAESLHGASAEAAVTQVTEGGPGEDQIVLTATNLGDTSILGQVEPFTITDTLPAGLQAVSIRAKFREVEEGTGTESCSLLSLACTFSGTVPPFGQIEIKIIVTAANASSGEVNRVSVSGGGTPGASIARPITVSEAEPAAGVEAH